MTRQLYYKEKISLCYLSNELQLGFKNSNTLENVTEESSLHGIIYGAITTVAH